MTTNEFHGKKCITKVPIRDGRIIPSGWHAEIQFSTNRNLGGPWFHLVVFDEDGSQVLVKADEVDIETC